ncbi:MAG TPA: hypothetical protein VFT51_03290 [Bacillales bacterium]|nr:hypothetical protein [Bacillales bacterium]
MDWRKIIKEVDHIWYYYKVHIIVGIVIAAFVAYFVAAGQNDKDKETALHVILTGNQVKVEEQKSLQHAATEALLGADKADSVIRIDFLPSGAGMNMAATKKMVAMIAASEIDVLVMDKETFSVLAKQGNFMKLDQLKEEMPKKVSFLKWSSRKGKHLYGVEIGQNHRLKKEGYNTTNKVMGVVANSQHPELARRFMKWLVDR